MPSIVRTEERPPIPDSDAMRLNPNSPSDMSPFYNLQLSHSQSPSQPPYLNHNGPPKPFSPPPTLPNLEYSVDPNIGMGPSPINFTDPYPPPFDAHANMVSVPPPPPPPPPSYPPPSYPPPLVDSDHYPSVGTFGGPIGLPPPEGYWIPTKTLQKFQRTMQLRQKAIKQRNKMELRRRNFANEISHSVAARESLVQFGDGFIGGLERNKEPSPGDLQNLRAAWDVLKNMALQIADRSKLIQKIGIQISKSDMDLIALDNKLHRLEEEILRETVGNADDTTLMDPDAISEPDNLAPTISISAASSEQLTPLEHEYYDAIGETNLAREHLFNLETEHRSSLYQRRTRREIGTALTIPEDDFWKDYFDERQRLVEKYVGGKKKVNELLKQCREEKLDVDAPNLGALGPQVLDQSNRVDRDPDIFDPGSSNRPPFHVAIGESLMRHEVRLTAQIRRARVLEWRRTLLEDSHNSSVVPSDDALTDVLVDDDEDEDSADSQELVIKLGQNHTRQSSDIASLRPLQSFFPDKPVRRYSDPFAQDRKVILQEDLSRHKPRRTRSSSITLDQPAL